MATQDKPDVNTVWASGASVGDVTPVPPEKQALGYVEEIPFYDDFNGHMQQISQFQKHVNLEGIPVWDAVSEYPVKGLAKSPVDREVYQAVSVNSNTPPVTTVGGAVNPAWKIWNSAEIANQIEAETGTNNTKTMTPLRVAQSIAARLKQATESILGIARIATATETNDGDSNSTIITPAKLTLGAQFSLGPIGYMKLPSWLGGLMFQWGNIVQTSTGITVTFPAPFPSANWAVFGQPVPGSDPAIAVGLTCRVLTRTQFQAYLTYQNQFITGGFYWFAIGR